MSSTGATENDRSDAQRARLAVVAIIERAFSSAGSMAYLGEQVTMSEHQLQAAALAQQQRCDEALVVAALLHDVGHVVDKVGSPLVSGFEADPCHEITGAQWLEQWFGADVTDPVRLHVSAKRFLVATEPAYASQLSEASMHTLGLQGGPMTAPEAEAFRRHPSAAAAVTLRRLDDSAKDPTSRSVPITAHRGLILRVLERGGAEK